MFGNRKKIKEQQIKIDELERIVKELVAKEAQTNEDIIFINKKRKELLCDIGNLDNKCKKYITELQSFMVFVCDHFNFKKNESGEYVKFIPKINTEETKATIFRVRNDGFLINPSPISKSYNAEKRVPNKRSGTNKKKK